MKKALVETICKLMDQKDNIFMFTGDLGYGVMTPIMEKHPSHFINVGICEQNMASVAAGMAIEGNVVFIYSIGNFPTLRCLEQIRNDIAYHHANVKIIAVGGGFAYGQLGMSHHATEDIAIMRAIPGMTVLVPADTAETIAAVQEAVSVDGPVYIRLGRGGEPDIKHKEMNIKSPMQIDVNMPDNKAKSVAILGAGIVMKDVSMAAQELSPIINVDVYSVPMIKPIDVDNIISICHCHQCLVTVEEHNIVGGLGSAIAEIIADNNLGIQFKRIGLNDQFTEVVGSPQYLRHTYGMDKDGIVSIIRKMVQDEKDYHYGSK